MLERRLRQQGIERAMGLLHRRMGRGLQRIDELGYRMRERLRAALDARERARRRLEARLARFDMRPRLAAGRRRMEALHAAAAGDRAPAPGAAAGPPGSSLPPASAQLSPLLVLERGYAIVSNESGILKDAAAAPPESSIHVRLARGSLDAVVSPIPESPPRSGGHRSES